MTIGFLFPGQGAQFPGMARDFYDHSQDVRELFEEASDASAMNVKRLLFEGTEDDLKQTDNTQIAVTVANLSARTVLNEFGIQSGLTAGFSLGEYAALVDAQVLALADAIRLTAHRGSIMERVSRTLDTDNARSGMAASMGKDLSEVEQILCDAGVSDAFPSLYNSPVQTVVGGTAAGLAAATEALKASGVRRVIPLKVSGPFHTPLMQDARVAFQEHVQGVAFSDPAKPLFSNVTGEVVTSGDQAKTLCLDQLVQTVLWTTEERSVLNAAPDRLLEVGPGTVLQGLWKAAAKTDDSWPADLVQGAGTLEEIDAIAQEVSNAH